MDSTISKTARKPIALSETQRPGRNPDRFTPGKVWLPKLLYDALPYFYVISGLAAFLATMYIGEWFWVLPHYLLFSAACLQLGFIIYRRRRPPQSSDPAGPSANELS